MKVGSHKIVNSFKNIKKSKFFHQNAKKLPIKQSRPFLQFTLLARPSTRSDSPRYRTGGTRAFVVMPLVERRSYHPNFPLVTPPEVLDRFGVLRGSDGLPFCLLVLPTYGCLSIAAPAVCEKGEGEAPVAW